MHQAPILSVHTEQWAKQIAGQWMGSFCIPNHYFSQSTLYQYIQALRLISSLCPGLCSVRVQGAPKAKATDTLTYV